MSSSRMFIVNSRSTIVKKEGFSLIELVVGMSILTVIALMAGGVYFANFRLFTNQSAAIDNSSRNRVALDEMVDQIREAKYADWRCCSPTEYTTPLQIVLRLWPLDNSGNPCDPAICSSNISDFIIYNCASTCPTTGSTTNLVKRVIPAPTSTRAASTDIVASNVKDLRFKYFTQDGTERTCSSPPYPNCVIGILALSAAQVTIDLTTESTFFTQKQQKSTIVHQGKAILRNYL